jgi:hypothetical protein
MQSALEPSTYQGMMYTGLALGKVFKVYPEANAVDVVLMDGGILRKVQVVSLYASSRTGVANLPIPEYKNLSNNLLDKQLFLLPCESNESDVFAIVAFLGNSIFKAIVLGFLYPEHTELLCDKLQDGNKDASQYLFKHASNVYTRISEKGDVEVSHPSGFFLKVGESVERTAINNYDVKVRPFKWKNPTTGELSAASYAYLAHPSGDTFTIDPEGNIEENIVGNDYITIEGNLDISIKGNSDETVEGDEYLAITGKMTESSTGTWMRSSDDSIRDTAPTINHNSGKTVVPVDDLDTF